MAATRPTQSVERDKIKLPMWAWALLAGGAAVVVWRFHQARQAAAQAPSTTPVDNGGAGSGGFSFLPVPTPTGESAGEMAQLNTIQNGINDLGGQVADVPAQTKQAQCVGQIDYHVKSGDTLNSVAAKYGISGAHLLQYNQGLPQGIYTDLRSGGSTIHQGQDVKVPWNFCNNAVIPA